MNKERFLPRALTALAIITLVVLANEGYRQCRELVDNVSQSKKDIATLKRDLYVLQVQIDNGPTAALMPTAAAPAGFAAASPPAPAAYPMPAPFSQTLPLPEAATRTRPKREASDEAKSMVSVVLMSDTKLTAPAAAAASAAAVVGDVKLNDRPKINVQLIGDLK